MTFQRILVALDQSSQTPDIFATALDMAHTQGGKLLLFHCLGAESEVVTGPFIGIGTIGDVELYGNLHRLQQEKLRQDVERVHSWLQSYAQQAVEAGIAAEADCRVGEAGRWICDAALNWKADLVIVGRRGREGLAEVLLGSISKFVVHHAPCAVLIVQGSNTLGVKAKAEAEADAEVEALAEAESASATD